MGLFDESTKSKPLQWQQQPIRDVFKRSQMATDRLSKAGVYRGDYYAGLNDNQNNGINQLTNWSNGMGGQLAGSIANGATANAAAGANYGNNAGSLFSQYSAPGAATQGILGSYNSFMDDPGLQNSIDAATRDVSRAFGEDTLLRNSSNAADGMASSTRAGVEQALARRDAQDRAGDIAAQMRSDARNQALNMASDSYFGGANLALGANSQVGNAAQVGSNMATDAQNLAQSNANMNLQAGGLQQQDSQSKIDQARQKWYDSNGGYQLGLQKDLYGIVGSNSWGSQQEGGDGGLSSALIGAGMTLGPAAVGAAFGGPAGMMAGFGMQNAGSFLPSSWGSGGGGGMMMAGGTQGGRAGF